MGPPIRPCACPSCLSASACVCVSGVWPKSVSVSACVCVSGVWPLCTQDILLADAARSLEAAKRAALRTFSWRVGHSRHSPGASGTQDILLARRAWPQPQHPLRTFSGLSRNTRPQPQHPVCRRTQDILLAHRAWPAATPGLSRGHSPPQHPVCQRTQDILLQLCACIRRHVS